MTKTHCNWAVSSFSDSYRKEKWERHLQNKISGDYTQSMVELISYSPFQSNQAPGHDLPSADQPRARGAKSGFR
ncbi:hypothetical protein H9L39_12740 [Fusarium oxysporum f. sp. albedinis]|nr:hypothetical protein H9L39_12740 [Fusarium oxysporum f. sp. albedinis]